MDPRGLSLQQRLAALALLAIAISMGLLPRGDFVAQALPTVEPLGVVVLVFAVAGGVAMGMLMLPVERAQPAEQVDRLGMLIVAAALLTAVALIGLIYISPQTLAGLVREDQFVEMTSVVLLFGGAVVLLVAAVRAWRVVFDALARGGFALLLLLIGLEEVSWFQRALGIETPEWLAVANEQGETNLHNLANHFSEYLYYFGAFVLLVFARALLLLPRNRFTQFVPSLPVLAVGALTAGMNYETWRVAHMPLALAVAVACCIAIAMAAAERRDTGMSLLMITVAIVTLGMQLTLLGLGHLMADETNGEEVREMLIALGLFAYACQLARLQRPAAG